MLSLPIWCAIIWMRHTENWTRKLSCCWGRDINLCIHTYSNNRKANNFASRLRVIWYCWIACPCSQIHFGETNNTIKHLVALQQCNYVWFPYKPDPQKKEWNRGQTGADYTVKNEITFRLLLLRRRQRREMNMNFFILPVTLWSALLSALLW